MNKVQHARILKGKNRKKARVVYALFFAGIFGIIGVILIVLSFASVPANNVIEPETDTLSGNATKATDANASNSQYVSFQAASCPAGQTGTPPNCVTPTPSTTLPPGSVLPSDATCSARVVHAVEVRPQNTAANAKAGTNKNLTTTPFRARVSGAYTGSTDDILQWVACKWGIDVDVVRAQAVKESYWLQSAKGDFTTDANSCPPAHGLGVDGTPGQCPESYGIIQDRWNYWGPPAGLNTWPEVETSTAYNLDLAYSSWRDCYEGNYGWLNTVEHTGTYGAGDLWGCVGIWFAGRWKTDPANTYVQAVQDNFNTKVWTTPGFINYR